MRPALLRSLRCWRKMETEDCMHDDGRPTWLSCWTETDSLGPDCGCSSAWEHRERCERDDAVGAGGDDADD